MKQECPPLESFEDLLALREDDPRRLHLQSCPRCRARAVAFRAFLDPGPLPEGARPGEARLQLSRAIRTEAARALTRHAGRKVDRRGDSGGIWAAVAAWFHPGWRSVVGLASVVAVVFLVARVAVDRQQGEAPVMRGGGPAGEFASSLPRVAATADGALSIGWEAVPGASRYAVAFYGLDMMELLQVGAADLTRLTLPPSSLGRLGPSGAVVFVRVLAFRGEDRIAQSAPVSVTLP